MKSKKMIKTPPTAKKKIAELPRDLSDSEMEDLRQDFYQSLLWLEKEDGIELQKLNFGEELPKD